jgi:hypothetical protein
MPEMACDIIMFQVFAPRNHSRRSKDVEDPGDDHMA